MCEIEEHEGVFTVYKDSMTHCYQFLLVRIVAKFGNIVIFGCVEGRQMCESLETLGSPNAFPSPWKAPNPSPSLFPPQSPSPSPKLFSEQTLNL